MMKKWISLLVIVSLVLSLGAVLGACGKGGDADASATTEETTVNEKNEFENAFKEMYSDFYDEDYSYTEHSTNEHYQEDYEALTLPAATKPVKQSTASADAVTTTKAPTRETTTKARMLNGAKAVTTTAKANTANGTTAKATTTNAAQNTTASDTTVMVDPIPETNVVLGNNNVSDLTVMPRPNVTYLDKFVLDVLAEGSYTAETEMKTEGMAMPITYYSDGENSAVKMSVSELLASSMDLPAMFSNMTEIRMITMDGKAYLAWTGGYMALEGEGMDDMSEMLAEARSSQDIRALLQVDRMQYCGLTKGNGYVVETYMLEEENVAYCFYFTSAGLTRWEVVDLSTKQVVDTMVVKLTKGVSDKDAFKISGKKYTVEDFEKMFDTAA